jgi:hypothetical protein
VASGLSGIKAWPKQTGLKIALQAFVFANNV